MANEYQHQKIRHAGEQDETEFQLQSGAPVSLIVSNSNGDLRVFASDRANAVVRTTKQGSGSGRPFQESFAWIDQHGNSLTVGVENVHWTNIGDLGRSIVDLVKGQGSFDDFGDVAIDVEVELPRDLAAQTTNKAKLNSASGNIDVVGLSGKVDVNSASGDVSMANGAVDLTVNTASGQVDIKDAEGRVTVRSASGDTDVHGGRLSRISVNTASGDVNVESAVTGSETSSINTASGDVRLRLALPAARLTLKTVSGDAKVKSPFEREGRGEWRLGPAGASSPTFNVKTVSGDLEVTGTVTEIVAESQDERSTWTSQPATPPTPPTPPTPSTPPTPPTPFMQPVGEAANAEAPTDRVIEESDPATDAERLNVLQALERGEIDIDEAMTRLDALEGPPAD